MPTTRERIKTKKECYCFAEEEIIFSAEQNLHFHHKLKKSVVVEEELKGHRRVAVDVDFANSGHFDFGELLKE